MNHKIKSVKDKQPLCACVSCHLSKDKKLRSDGLVNLWIVTFLSAGQYLNLDKDHNGMLSKEELSRYGTATLTSVFLDRVFQECLTYDGEMVQSLI